MSPPQEPTSIAAVILAAGRSSRMGPVNKLLARVDGAPMVRRVCKAIVESQAAPAVLVTGHEAALVRGAVADLELVHAHNADFARGMSTSIRAGLDALPDHVSGALIVLADMPWLDANHVDALIDAFDPAAGIDICAPSHGGRRGNPVLWGARHFASLRRLAGDTGARELLADRAERLRLVELDDAVARDVDTPDALNYARRRGANREPIDR